MRYEYIRLGFDWGDLSELNNLSIAGWRVVAVERMEPETVDISQGTHWALLERSRSHPPEGK